MAETAVTVASDSEDESPRTALTKVQAWDGGNVAVIPMTALMQPLLVGRTLIQVGYEPMEPVLGKSMFLRKPNYYYPNMFQYLHYLRKKEGYSVLLTGFTPKLLNVFLSSITEKLVDQAIRKSMSISPPAPKEKKDKALSVLVCDIAITCAAKTAAVLVTQPLHVIMVRMICSIVSDDKPYRGCLSSISEIYQTEGIAGFFSGLIPRWLADVITVSLGGFLVYGIGVLLNQAGLDENLRSQQNYQPLVQFTMSSIVYKYQLTSTVIAASTKGLHLGLPSYKSWGDVLSDLQRANQLTRGASYFYRRANL